jgi:methylthioribose-1-phosphate isomerase
VDTAPPGIAVLNPAFDVTPHGYVSAIITEFGVARPPYLESLSQAVGSSKPE